MGLTVAGVLRDAADRVQHEAGGQQSPAATAVLLGGAAVMRIVAELVAGKSDAEALAIMEHIRDHGTKPITDADKAGQAQAAVDAAFGR